MNHLLLKKNVISEQLVKYDYIFAEHGFSPAHQILTRLFREMILAVQESLDQLEVEYVDHRMAKELGIKKAQQILNQLGATKDNIIENKHGDVVLSRSFSAPLSSEALDYFKALQDLEELAAYRLLSGQQVKVEVFFVKTMSVYLNPEEEQHFFERLDEVRMIYKVTI
ncbi:MAG TPA: hypothetical protein VJ824_14650 [Bacillota bacterium]|nr:hypothetical protein [Bacillota bacterium]